MPQTHPLQTSLQHSSQPARYAKRSVDIHEDIEAGPTFFRVFEPCARFCDDGFEDGCVVEMELVNQTTSDHFDIAVYIDWERYYPNTNPPKNILFGIARQLVREHFEAHRYPARLSGHKRKLVFYWPEPDEYEGTV